MRSGFEKVADAQNVLMSAARATSMAKKNALAVMEEVYPMGRKVQFEMVMPGVTVPGEHLIGKIVGHYPSGLQVELPEGDQCMVFHATIKTLYAEGV